MNSTGPSTTACPKLAEKAIKRSQQAEPGTSRSCGVFFQAWCANLAGEYAWVVCDILGGMVWHSPAMWAFYPLPPGPAIASDIANRFIHKRDVDRVGHYHSLALKTGEPWAFRLRLRTAPNRCATLLENVFPKRCPRCENHCAVLICWLEFLEGWLPPADDEEDQAGAWRPPI